MRRGVCLVVVVLSFSALAASASAQLATVQFQGSYQGFDPYVAWAWWLSPAQMCAEPQPLYGSEPAAGGTYPVLIYLHSTLADWGYNMEGQEFVQSAAAHGFVAVAVTYDSWFTWLSPPAMDLHANCMFNTSNPGNAIAQVCARPEADCSKGFVVAGFSQGGAIAARSANVNSAVQAVWAIGVNGPNIPEAIAAPIGNRVLPNNRLRITVGQHDVAMDASGHPDLSALNAMTGQGCTTFSCLAPDGSGYYVVANSDTPSGNASHCYWFLNGGCSISPTLDAAFVNGTADWSLSANLSFLASRVSASIAPSADIDPRKLVVRRGAGRHPLVVGADGRLVRLRATTWQYARSHVADIRRRLNR